MRQFFEHRLTLVLAGVLTLLFIVSLQSSIRSSTSSQKVGVLEQKIRESSSENSQIYTDIEKSQTEYYKKKRIHDELLLQKPDEQTIQLPPRPTPSPTPVPSPSPVSVWEEWKEVLK